MNDLTEVVATYVRQSPFPPSFSGSGQFFSSSLIGQGTVLFLSSWLFAIYVRQIIKDKSAKWNSAVTCFRSIIALASFNAIITRLPDWIYLLTFNRVPPYVSSFFLNVRRVCDGFIMVPWITMAVIILFSGPQIVYALKHPMIIATFDLRGKTDKLKEIVFWVSFITLFSILAAVAKHYEFLLTAH